MFDLIYPLDMPQVLPPRRAGDAAAVALEPGRKEMFPVVDPSGLVEGIASRQYCPSGSKVLHPVVHLHIIDRFGRQYLQKRTMKKDILPGTGD